MLRMRRAIARRERNPLAKKPSEIDKAESVPVVSVNSRREIVMVRRILLIAAALVLAGVAYLVFSMGPRNLLGMIRYDQRREGHLRVGDRAPDVELVALDGVRRVHLRDFVGGQPLVLVFGSYT